MTPHPFTDQRNRNLCDTCDKYVGHKAHVTPQESADPREAVVAALDAIEDMATDRDYDTVTASAAAGILRAALAAAPLPSAHCPSCDMHACEEGER